MAKKLVAKEKCEHTINLLSLKTDGSFQCPRCATSISPDDDSDDNYQIIDTKVVRDELTELVIACGKCECIIRLTGFQQILDA